MKENDIRPKEIFNEYLRLAEEDIKTFFSECKLLQTKCPACEGLGEAQFNKKGFDYCLCNKCMTLFVNPRPSRETFNKYYQDSASARYCPEHFYKDTEEARRKKIWAPKARLVWEKIKEYAPASAWIADIGAGYGIFCEELKKVSDILNIYAIEPSDALSKACVSKGLKVVKKFMEDLDRADICLNADSKGVFTCFELLEHVFDPFEFFRTCSEIMLSGDLVIFTTLNGKGFDIQVLWKDSKSIYPPHHLNFFNPSSIVILLERCGFEVLEVTTPGKLDVDIVVNNSNNVNDRFIKSFLESAGEKEKENLQKFLQNNKLSSHMMVVARKI